VKTVRTLFFFFLLSVTLLCRDTNVDDNTETVRFSILIRRACVCKPTACICVADTACKILIWNLEAQSKASFSVFPHSLTSFNGAQNIGISYKPNL